MCETIWYILMAKFDNIWNWIMIDLVRIIFNTGIIQTYYNFCHLLIFQSDNEKKKRKEKKKQWNHCNQLKSSLFASRLCSKSGQHFWSEIFKSYQQFFFFCFFCFGNHGHLGQGSWHTTRDHPPPFITIIDVFFF